MRIGNGWAKRTTEQFFKLMSILRPCHLCVDAKVRIKSTKNIAEGAPQHEPYRDPDREKHDLLDPLGPSAVTQDILGASQALLLAASVRYA